MAADLSDLKNELNPVAAEPSKVVPDSASKTRVALTIIQSLVKANPDSFTIIVVPTEMLKNQWMEELIKWHLFEHCQIEIINSVINKEWTCDLLVIDEAHLMASDTFQRVFDVVEY